MNPHSPWVQKTAAHFPKWTQVDRHGRHMLTRICQPECGVDRDDNITFIHRDPHIKAKEIALPAWSRDAIVFKTELLRVANQVYEAPGCMLWSLQYYRCGRVNKDNAYPDTLVEYNGEWVTSPNLQHMLPSVRLQRLNIPHWFNISYPDDMYSAELGTRFTWVFTSEKARAAKFQEMLTIADTFPMNHVATELALAMFTEEY